MSSEKRQGPARGNLGTHVRVTLQDALRQRTGVGRTSWEGGESLSIGVPGFSMSGELAGSGVNSHEPVIIRTTSGGRYATDFRVVAKLPAWNPRSRDFGPADTRVAASHIGKLDSVGSVEVGVGYEFAHYVGDDSPVEMVTFAIDGFMREQSSPEFEEVFRHATLDYPRHPYHSLPIKDRAGIQNPVISAGGILARVEARYANESALYAQAVGNMAVGNSF